MQKGSFGQFYSSMLAFLVGVMLVMPKIIALPIIILIALTIYGIFKRLLLFSPGVLPILFVLLYSLYFVGIFFSEDATMGIKYLEYKLSFLLLPFIFSWKSKQLLNLQLIGVVYIGSLFLVFLLGLKNGYDSLDSFSVFNSFTSSRFSNIHHPAYLSLFALFGLEFIRSGYLVLSNKSGYKVAVVLFLILIQLMCLSLAGLMLLSAYGMIVIVMKLKRRYEGKMLFVITLLGLMVTALLLFSFPNIKLQVKSAYDSVKLYMEDPEDFVRTRQTYVTGNETRLIMWTATLIEIQNHPMGVGTGSVDIHLAERLKLLKQSDTFIEHHYNPHNQFLQTWLEIGVFGFLNLVLILFFAIKRGISSGNTILVVLSFLLVFNALFESVLQRQSGIVFFTLWFCIIPLYFNQTYLQNRLSK